MRRRFMAVFFIAAGALLFITNASAWWQGYSAAVPLDQHDQLPKPKRTAAIGEPIGTLLIPKLNLALPIFHGTEEEQLKKGVGHDVRSALPGERNNVVLSGHRDTVFQQLGKVGVDDVLIVATATDTFTYQVRNVRIVDADDRTVIVPKPRATLTVTTCYPFHFIGNAPKRYVLVAELIRG
nr:class D sortase [Thermolongibacillus altinsuensis]